MTSSRKSVWRANLLLGDDMTGYTLGATLVVGVYIIRFGASITFITCDYYYYSLTYCLTISSVIG